MNGRRNSRKHRTDTSRSKRRQVFLVLHCLGDALESITSHVICMCVSQLKRENARLLKALSVEKNSGSSLKKLQRQVVSLSSQLSQKDRLIKSQEEKVGYLLLNHKQWMKVRYNIMQLSENVYLKVKLH